MKDFEYRFSENGGRGMEKATIEDFLYVSIVSWYDCVLIEIEFKWFKRIYDKIKPCFELCYNMTNKYEWT